MITLDDHPNHPTVVFLQDVETRFTIALDAESGETISIGLSDVIKRTPASVLWAMAGAVVAYQRERRELLRPGRWPLP